MKRSTPQRAPAEKAGEVSASLDAFERLLAELGPEPDENDAALQLWQPARALGDAVRED